MNYNKLKESQEKRNKMNRIKSQSHFCNLMKNYEILLSPCLWISHLNKSDIFHHTNNPYYFDLITGMSLHVTISVLKKKSGQQAEEKKKKTRATIRWSIDRGWEATRVKFVYHSLGAGDAQMCVTSLTHPVNFRRARRRDARNNLC